MNLNKPTKVDVMTKQGPPDPFSLPTINPVNSTSLEIKWNDPLKPNGFITGYIIQMVRPTGREFKIVGEQKSGDGHGPLCRSYVITGYT